MFVLKPLHRAIWIALFAGVAVSVLVWIAWNDPAINFLPREISVAEEALNRARGFGDNDAIKLTESILASLRYSLPYRQEPE